jgi:thiosulfate/3-mercaptopyruvate sulfurtransferase
MIMNRKIILVFVALIALFFAIPSTIHASAGGDPWTADQLMEPQTLATIIKAGKGNALPVILNIGSVDAIKGAITTGAVSEPDGFAELKKQLKNIKKDKLVVIYCGCCPLFKCPNIRPAFKELVAEGFSNIKVLNLKKNLQTDWVDKNYPMQDAR